MLLVTAAAISASTSWPIVHAVEAGSLGQDGLSHIGAGRLELHDQSGAEALGQAVLEVGELLRGPVGGEHELPARVEQGVEGVEELLARGGPAGEELDVVDEDTSAPRKSSLKLSVRGVRTAPTNSVVNSSIVA